ncbi:hypothetical protein N9D27_01405 [Gammaproteobacteria bacterium]|jgi:hypothetical protein|nr:hypothetical protein [Gammaproteobacteria bacterium]
MKKLIALLLLSPLAFAEDIEFNLNCKITEQSIMTTENILNLKVVATYSHGKQIFIRIKLAKLERE